MQLQQIIFTNPNPENDFPSYSNQVMPRMLFDSVKAQKVFEENKDSILQIVESEITDYINNDELCNDFDNMFPQRSRLTGKWYIKSVYFENEILSISSALLGLSWNLKPDDYLGLEIHFKYEQSDNQFIVYGVDSSCI